MAHKITITGRGIVTGIGNVFTAPIPIVTDIPGISHITGKAKLKKINKTFNALIADSAMQEEMEQINVDRAIFKKAEARDEHDRDLQKYLFGNVVFKRETKHYRINEYNVPDPTPDRLAILAAFTELEKLKAHLRYTLRPEMENQHRIAITESAKTPHRVTKELAKVFETLKHQRLTMLTERDHMMEQRNIAYQMVSEFINKGRVETIPDAGDIAAERKQQMQSVKTFLESYTTSENAVEDEIKALQEKQAGHHNKTEELKTEMNIELGKQNKKIHQRPIVWASVVTTAIAAFLGARAGKVAYTRSLPLSALEQGYTRIAPDTSAQTAVVLKTSYTNPLSKNRVVVNAYSVETNDNPEMKTNAGQLVDLSYQNDFPAHSLVAVRLLDQSYVTASGSANSPTDRLNTTLYALPAHSNAPGPPLLMDGLNNGWDISPFSAKRSAAIEAELTSTKHFNIFNQSMLLDFDFPPGSGAARGERDFQFHITCPITLPAGNPANDDDVVQENSQHPNGLSHYGRYTLQVGEADFGDTMGAPQPAYQAYVGSHPGPFVLFPVPLKLEQDFKDVASKTEQFHGTSYAAPGLAGHLAAIKSQYPQLSWDNILYAVALGCNKNRVEFTDNTFENRVQGLCDILATPGTKLTPDQQQATCDAINSVLTAYLPEPLNLKTMHQTAPSLENAIQKKYAANHLDRLDALMQDVKTQMGNAYPPRMYKAIHFKNDPQETFFTASSDSDLTYSQTDGFGVPDTLKTQLILQNMLLARLRNPAIKDDPDVIVQDAMDSGPASKFHTIKVPKDKDIFRMIFDIVPPPNLTNGVVTVRDDHGRSFKINLVDKVPISHNSYWGRLAEHGGRFTVTAPFDFRLGYAAHVNAPGAITLGVTKLSDLKTTKTLTESLAQYDLAKMPFSMPKAPTIINARDQGRGIG